jgi:hypothetical protein
MMNYYLLTIAIDCVSDYFYKSISDSFTKNWHFDYICQQLYW